MKKIKILAITAVFCALFATTAFAGTWKMDAKGWWWDNGNGTYPAGCWQWCDGNGDGTAECYYFDKDGYMYSNTTTPDGYTVNADGAWVENGTVQTQGTATGTAAATTGSKACDGSGVSGAAIAEKLTGYSANEVDSSRPAWKNGVTNLKCAIGFTIHDWYTGNSVTGGGYVYKGYPHGSVVCMALSDDGYFMADTYTPDGYYVNKMGAVEINGITVAHESDFFYAVQYPDGTSCDPNNYDYTRVLNRDTHSLPTGLMPWGKLIYMSYQGLGNPPTWHDPIVEY